MPIYEYRCETCGTFEVTQRITEKPLRRCPTCNAKVSKLISATSFQLKGSGWYVTDYAGKRDAGGGKQDEVKSDSASAKESKDSSKSEPAKTDSKAAKADSKAPAAAA